MAGTERSTTTTLTDRLDDWLAAAARRQAPASTLTDADLAEALRNLLGWDAMRALDRIAPARLDTPAGIERTRSTMPPKPARRVELRPQALFGLAAHPTVANGAVPLVLSLTSPAGRPIQTTRDLPGFWAGSWAAVAKEMRGRYPRHPWPDDPAARQPDAAHEKR